MAGILYVGTAGTDDSACAALPFNCRRCPDPGRRLRRARGPGAIAMAPLAFALLGLGTAGGSPELPGETATGPPGLRGRRGVRVSYAP